MNGPKRQNNEKTKIELSLAINERKIIPLLAKRVGNLLKSESKNISPPHLLSQLCVCESVTLFPTNNQIGHVIELKICIGPIGQKSIYAIVP